jgi:uncharacterized protein (TIGR02466 family)
MNPRARGQQTMQMRSIFPTPVGEYDHPDATSLNAGLTEFVHKVRDQGPTESRESAIRSGWRSRSDLLDYDAAPIRAFRSFVDQCLHSFVERWVNFDRLPHVPRRLSHRYKGWAVILEQGAYQQQHVHSRTDLVGVYCVGVPQPTPDFPEVGGQLTLVDPRSGRLSTRTSWETDLVMLEPQPGRLILMPSYIPHRIEPLLAPGERMTINFDTIVLSR